MPTVLLVRHGRTTANAAGILAGRTSGVHLDDHGRAQARAAGDRVRGIGFAAAVSSPMLRCKETARLVLPGTKVTIEHGLNECDYGQWSGRPLKDLAKQKLWKTVQSQPSAAAFPGGESMAQMSSRAVEAVRRWDLSVAEAHGERAVWVAFSHGDVIKAILADALGMHLDQFQRLNVSPASISVVSYTDQRPYVAMVNTTAGSLSDLAGTKKPRRTSAVVGGSAD